MVVCGHVYVTPPRWTEKWPLSSYSQAEEERRQGAPRSRGCAAQPGCSFCRSRFWQRDLAWDRIRALEMLSREVMLLDTFISSGPCLSPALLLLELQDPNPLKLTALNGKSTEGREQATRSTAPLSASEANDLVAVTRPISPSY